MRTSTVGRRGRRRTGGGALLLGAMLFVIPLGFSWTNHTQTQAATSDEDGERIYMMRCMSCHQTDGKAARDSSSRTIGARFAAWLSD